MTTATAREAVLLGLVLGGSACQRAMPLTFAHALAIDEKGQGEIVLPAPRTRGTMSLEEALAQRRSVREQKGGALAKEELGQLLWAAQGVSDGASSFRTAPSAGALYPLAIYVVSTDGVLRYEPASHALRVIDPGDRRAELARAALGQAAVGVAATSFVVVGITARTRAKYGARAERYVALEAGHASQNLLLEATALGLAAVPLGAFDDDAVRAVVRADASATPLYVIPVGKR